MEKTTTQNETTAYPKTASIIALIGGIIITLGGVLFIAVSAFVLPNIDLSKVQIPQGLTEASLRSLISGVVGVMGAFGLVTGVVVLVSAIMLMTHVGNRRTWGILILIFSVLSFVGLGGFIAGAILGIVGGVMTLRWKPSTF